MHRHRRRRAPARSPTRSAARPSRRTPRSPGAPTSSSSATSPPSSSPSRSRSRRTPRRSSRSSAGRRFTPSRPPTRTARCTAILPSTPVEVRQGAVILAADDSQDEPILDARVRELFASLGRLVVLDDALMDVAMGLMSNAPAYYALVVEAQVDAGVRKGIPPAPGGRARRRRRWPAPRSCSALPRVRHARGAPQRHLARRVDRARPRRARARRAAGGVLGRDGRDPEDG